MKRIVVLAAGGSISLKRGPMVDGAVPSLRGDDFLALLPRDEFQLAFAEYLNVPGSHRTPAQVLELAQKAESILLAPNVDGLVITHSTDTLEETAYLLDLTINSPKPVVVTGAARSAAAPSYDGISNLIAAIRVAASSDARGQGTLVVFHDSIYAAAEVQQVHSQALNGFDAPWSGALGQVEGGQIWLRRKVAQRTYIPCSRLEERVDLIRIGQGAEDRMLRHSINDSVAGIVIEAFGSGRVPPWWLPYIREAIQQRIAVAIAPRCGAGSLYDDFGFVGGFHDLRKGGVLFAHQLDGLKARIKLMVALGAARGMDDVRGWFEK
jgi:L-asparaginase